MAILTKDQLTASNSASFQNNTNGDITPAVLRNFNQSVIDTLVDSLDTGSFATSAITGSSLITASFSGQTLTFTKGNATQFSVIINTASGSIPADLTSLNAFTQSQDTKNLTLASYTGSVDTKFSTIGGQSGSWDNTALNTFSASQVTKDSTLATYTASVDTKFSTIGSQSGSWDNTSLNSFTQSVDTKFTAVGSSTSSLNSYTSSQDTKNSTLSTYTASVDTKFSTLGGQTGSYVTSGITGSSLVTASFSGNTLTFTKGNGTTFGVVIPDVSGSTLPAGTISGSSQITALGFVSSSVTGSSLVTGSVSGNILTFTKGDATQFSLTVATGSGGGDLTSLNAFTASQLDINTGYNAFTSSTDTKFATIGSQSGSWGGGSINTGSFATTGSNNFIGNQTITGSVNVSGGERLFIKRSTAGANNLLRLGATDNENNFAFIVTGSDTNPGQQVWGINVGGGVWANSFDAGVVFNSTVLATGMTSKHLTLIDTADNASSISGASGSLLLTAKGFTSSSAHISASTATQVNLIFKNNSNTGDTILSGSNNIFVNPAAPTAGFKRYFGGSGNIVLQTAAPQISSSMGFSPTMTNNIWGGSGASPTMRGPVSSSAWTISNNIVNNQGAWNIGTAAATDAKQLISGFNAASNVGSVFPAITAYKTPLSASVSFTANTGTGQVAMNCDSSSIVVSGNGHFGSTTINNSYFPATINGQTGNIVLATNTLFGTSIINASGSDTTFTGVSARGAFNSVIGGFSTIGLVLNGDNSSLNSSAIVGGGLVVTGSNSKQSAGTANTDWGSAFFGRWNDVSNNKAISGPTVFAVGTGTSTTRKTGFLIDSGSNTFVEGTLNVSGSTSTTGSITIQSGSGDLFVHGHKQFNVGAFQSNINQSGSANVSQSMQFETTDLSYGVTMVSNSQITIANAGVYNIQFSAQLLADTGADNVWIWLKKNGTNVPATAGHVVLANNDELIASWNYVIDAAAGDYYELAWQSSGGDAVLLAETATGNIPSIPSVILTVTQAR